MANTGALEVSLILRAQSGRDDQAFSRLVSMYQAKVRGFLLRLCRRHSLADDLAQDTFLIAYQKLRTYQGSGEFGAWLCSIAYRCFLQHYRKQQRQQEIQQEFAGDQSVQADFYESMSGAQRDLENAMRQLSEAEAAAITLCHSYGYSHSEVAGILELPLGTIKSHINRGKEKLRQLLSNEGISSETMSATTVGKAS